MTIGCLLHDIGKIVYRADADAGNHSELGYGFLSAIPGYKDNAGILNCARYHHAKSLKDSGTAENDISSICYIADNISAAADRRQTGDSGTFDRYIPLSPVFSHLNGEHPGYSLKASTEGKLVMPLSGNNYRLTQGDYRGILLRLKEELSSLPPEEEWVNSILSVLEACTSSVPSSTNTKESVDISLYDHAKICAAAGACISEYLADKETESYRKTLFENETSFRDEKAFILFSADYSGIQKFIYTVSTSKALRTLRSRSFFLELSLEHYIDELLSACGVSRANLLYSGGGHCYILLPNTDAVKRTADEWNTKFNDWLIKEFGGVLYLAASFTECSANDLTNTPSDKSPYKEMFRRVSSEISRKKNARYSYGQVLALNSSFEEGSERECAVCGRSDRLTEDEDGRSLCPWCSLFESLSAKIQNRDIFVVSKNGKGADIVFPGFASDAYIRLTDPEEARRSISRNPEEIIRVYTKNAYYAGLNCSTRLHVGDYAKSNQLQELAEMSEGVPRLGICRLDVDNLGQAFVSGFEDGDAAAPEEKGRFVTISRTAAFSRQMSLFFKGYINSVLDGTFGHEKPLNVSIVYSGGDDVFVVGAWTDTIAAADRIQKCFNEYCCGALTISGGVAIVDSHYPIRIGAEFAADLEDNAKSRDGKNGISLFEADGSHCYGWDEYRDVVIGDKLETLEDFFSAAGDEKGNAFLYRIVSLLREAQSGGNKMPIARYAYMLARLEPKNRQLKDKYREFSDKMYGWALDRESRKQLITAIYLYVYSTRERGNR